MKVEPVTKLDNRNTVSSKKIDDDFMWTNCEFTVIFPISGKFGAIRKPDSGRMVCKTYIFISKLFINVNLLFYKN